MIKIKIGKGDMIKLDYSDFDLELMNELKLCEEDSWLIVEYLNGNSVCFKNHKREVYFNISDDIIEFKRKSS